MYPLWGYIGKIYKGKFYCWVMDFENLGLRKREAKVFEAVVKLGKGSAGEISAESGVPHNKVYEVLYSLERKGLVRIIPGRKKNYFVASDPEKLERFVKERIKQLEAGLKEIDRLKKLYRLKEIEPVVVARGRGNFYRLVKEIPEAKKKILTVKYTVEYRPEWEREYRQILKKGGVVKELVRCSKETEKSIRRWLKIHKDIRCIPNEGVAISVRDEKMVLIALIKSNASILIRDKAFAKLMGLLLENYYGHAKKPEI